VRTPVVVLLLVVALAAAMATAVLRVRDRHPAAAVLAAQGAGVAADEAAYPRQGTALRARAWLIEAPGQPAGIDLFTTLEEVAFAREHQVTSADLRTALARIRGLAWDGAAAAWSGGGRTVPLDEVRRLLNAALPTPATATAVLDLLLGQPAPGVPDLAGLLLAEPSTLRAIRLVPFRGGRGRLLVDRGRPPYVAVERGYSGLAAAFDGDGWPAGWRILHLRADAP